MNQPTVTYRGTRYTAENLADAIATKKAFIAELEQDRDNEIAKYESKPVDRRDDFLVQMLIEDIKLERANLKRMIILAARF